MTSHPNRGKSARINPTAEQVRQARAESGLSQVEAARLIYCSERSWQQWEAGERKMHGAMWELFRIKARTLVLLRQQL